MKGLCAGRLQPALGWLVLRFTPREACQALDWTASTAR